ncbi:class I SAM-dependent methyltransferase [Actinophytocola sp. KF-1]
MNRLRDADLASAFDAGAPAYDLLVDRNPGYHEHLRLSAERGLTGTEQRVLDAGCGTGASTAAVLSVAPHAEVVGVDAAGAMLDRARAKRWPPGVRFVHSGVEDLAAAGVTGPFDAVFAAYLFRNLTDPDGQLRALLDLLRPGGTLVVHDYVAGADGVTRAKWHAVCWGIVIPLAVVHRGGTGLYRHLWRSVAEFDDAQAFANRVAAAGFDRVRFATVPGWQRGIEHTFLATRPDQRAERNA